MHALERRTSDQDVSFIIEHLVRESQALLFELDERRSYRYDITGVQLLNVRYVLIDRGHASACRAQVRWREAQGVKELPSRFVKLSYVPHDVHVSHVITVPRVHSTAIGKQSFGHEDSPGAWPIATLRGRMIPAARCGLARGPGGRLLAFCLAPVPLAGPIRLVACGGYELVYGHVSPPKDLDTKSRGDYPRGKFLDKAVGITADLDSRQRRTAA
jgi:hypothetical protein